MSSKPKKLITNPAWEAAQFELNIMSGGKVIATTGRRANGTPPEFKDWREFMRWFTANEVPRYIEANETIRSDS